MINEYLWDVNVRGKYDTEHDLYQYNFMGYTGRFYIKKENNSLNVVKLDNNALKITNTYNGTTYVHDSFTIVDEYGNKYIFNVKEISTFSNDNFYYIYNSAFHLAEIRDANDVLLVTLNYASTNGIKEGVNLSTVNYNFDTLGVLPNYVDMFANNGLSGFNPLPDTEVSFSQITTITKKLEVINIHGLSNIYFNYSIGRSDTNLLLANSSYKLQDINIKDRNDANYRKYNFLYTYSTVNIYTKMMLDQVQLLDINENEEANYQFAYKQKTGFDGLSTDYWGYFNKIQCGNRNWEPTPDFSDIDVIQKIKYPEGGSVIFDFESNTYSYESDVAITDFTQNPENSYVDSQESHSFNSYPPANNLAQDLSFSSQVQYLDIYPGLTYGVNNSKFLYLKIGTTTVQSLACPDVCPDCKVRVILDANTQYQLKFQSSLIGQNETLDVNIDYVKPSSAIKEYLYGGGNRIKKIGYFDKNVNPLFYDQYPVYLNEGTPQKEVNYDYSYFDNSLKSSGALVYPRPKYMYGKSKKECIYVGEDTWNGVDEFDISYTVQSETNNLAAIKTKGADVGYKSVTVYETNNGYKRMVFSNSLDFPEDIGILNVNPPFLPTLNIDYKRGYLLQEEIYNQQHNLLKRTINTYVFEDFTQNTGIKVFNPYSYQFVNVRGHNYYSSYKNYLDTHITGCFCCFDFPISFTNSEFHYEAFGWVKSSTTDTEDYFYNNGSYTHVDSHNEVTYNSSNYKIENEKITDAYGGIIETKHFYPTDVVMASKPYRSVMLDRNLIGTPLVTQKFRGSEKLFEKEVEYGSFSSGNVNYPLILPKYLYSKKGDVASNPIITDVVLDSYDTQGNLTQYTPKNGFVTSVIWGYLKTQPVAKIENIDYATIPSNLIVNIQDASDSVDNSSEALLISTIDDLQHSLAILRNSAALSDAMLTTYTYIPLVGVRSVTDSKGDTSTYIYDEFGRLKEVRDKDDNILSTNEYHYKPQN